MKKLYLIILLISAVSFSVCHAETLTVVDGMFYSIEADGTAILYGPNANPDDGEKNNVPSVLDIPETITYGLNTYSVVGVTHNAFFQCNTLEKVVFPSSMKRIGSFAFCGCQNLNEVVFNNGLEVIGHRSFENTISLEAAELPVTVNEIESLAFWGSGIRRVNIPPQVKRLYFGTFSECSRLGVVNFSEGLEYIESGTFTNDKALKEVIIPASVNSLENGFIDNAGVEKLVFTDTEKELSMKVGNEYSGPWYNLPQLQSLYLGRPIVTENWNGEGTVINNHLFSDLKKLETVTFGPTFHSIATAMFSGCTSMKQIDIPETVTEIYPSAFASSGLMSVTIPLSISLIEENTFYNCASLRSFELSPSVNTIGRCAFENCISLENIFIGPEIKKIGSRAFAGINNVQKLEIAAADNPLELETEGSMFGYGDIETFSSSSFETAIINRILEYDSPYRGLFEGSKIKHAIFGEGITEIPDKTFYSSDYGNLESVELPSTLLHIGKSAFDGNNQLVHIDLPDGLLSIGACAFERCYMLDGIIIPASVETIGMRAFCYDSGVKIIDFKSTVDTLELDGTSGNGSSLFERCSPEKIVFGRPLKVMNNETLFNSTYYSTQIKKVIFEKECTGIDVVKADFTNSRAATPVMFKSSFGIEEVRSESSVPPAVPNLFEADVYKNATLYVPVGATDAYRTADIWKSFNNIAEIDIAWTESIEDKVFAIEGQHILAPGKPIEVYNLTGTLIGASKDQMLITSPGIYIIKIVDKAIKVNIR